jgi:hypothetical protein
LTISNRPAASLVKGKLQQHLTPLPEAAHMKPLVLTTLAIWLLAAPGAAAADSQEAWAALVNGSHVALIRHGNAPPGYGDPPGFKIDDCATQRNLDEKGRAQARGSAKRSVNTVCAQTRFSPRPGAGAWRRRG